MQSVFRIGTSTKAAVTQSLVPSNSLSTVIGFSREGGQRESADGTKVEKFRLERSFSTFALYNLQAVVEPTASHFPRLHDSECSAIGFH